MDQETSSSMDSKYNIGFSFFGESTEDEPEEGETEDTRVQETTATASDQTKNTQSGESYFQSQYDKLKNEYARIEKYKNIAEYLESNPEMINELIEKTANKGKKEEPKIAEPTMPEKPMKPKNFDRIESLEDPDSESGKYLQRLEEYREARIAYFEEKENFILEKKTKEAEEATQIKNNLEQEAARIKNNTEQEKQLRTDLLNFGLPVEKHNDFMKVMGSPESLTLENVVTFYNFLTSEDKLKRKSAQSTEEFKKKAVMSNTPLPIGGVGGQKEPDREEAENDFSLSLLSTKRDR